MRTQLTVAALVLPIQRQPCSLPTPTGGGQIVGMHCETCRADTVGGVLRAEIHLATASVAAPAEPSL